MPYASLRDFMARLEQAGRLVRVTAPVSPHLEMTEIQTRLLAEEGPYGDHTGYYNSVEKFPVFTLSAITMRKNPIYLSTFTGRPPDEPSVLGEALNEVFMWSELGLPGSGKRIWRG